MADTYSTFPIRFTDIAMNPHILALYRGFASFLPDSHWWVLDEKMVRHPFPFSDSTPFCKTAEDDPAQQKRILEILVQSIFSDQITKNTHILDCCDGFLQGITEFRYRGILVGGIGICKVKSEDKPLLSQILRIIEGYLSLLANTLENNDDLELVHHLLSDTISVLNLDQLLERLTDELCSTLGLENGLILLINEDGEFYPAFVRNFPKELLRLRNLHLTRYEYQEPYRKNTPPYYELVQNDPLRDWFLSSLKNFRIIEPSDDISCMAIPFVRNNYMIGILLTAKAQVDVITSARERLVQLLSVGGAAALDNALILERMNLRRKALSTIHVVHRLISANISAKEMMGKIGQLTRQLLKVRKCSIMLMDNEKEKLIPRITLGLDKNEVGQQIYYLGEGLPGWVAENLNPYIFHPNDLSSQPWENIGETYPSESYLSVALFDDDIEGVITVADSERDFTPGDREILLTFAEQAILAIKSARLHESERSITVNVLKSIANLIETHEPTSPGVTVKTCNLTQKIARKLNVNERDYQNITYAALLHDAGMLRMLQSKIPIEEHQVKGRQLSLQFVKALGLDSEVEDIVYHIHETWNGHGRPDELKGSQIPLGSRIIAVAHAYILLHDRYSHENPHDTAHEKSMKVIDRLNRRSFDPDVVNALEQILHEHEFDNLK